MQIVQVEQFVGQTFGKYRVERFLGRGRLNAVYLARNLESQQTDALALYLVPSRLSSQAKTRFVERFRREAALVAALKHPHILPVYACGELLGYPYLVTPYRTKGSLSDNLKRNGSYDHSFVSSLLPQIVSALKYAHAQNIIHATLRPSTIIIGESGEVQVAGFGLLNMLRSEGVEQVSSPYAHLFSIANTLLVAPEYVAPELVQRQPIDRRTDIYSLGCVLFELLSGKPPFSGGAPLEIMQKHVTQTPPSLRSLCPQLPVVLSSVVHQAIERHPEQRFEDVDELCEAFVQASQGAMSYTQKQRAQQVVKQELIAATLPGTLQEEHTFDTSAAYLQTGEHRWQFQPPIVTSRVTAVKPSSIPTPLGDTGRYSKAPAARTPIVNNPPQTEPEKEKIQTAYWQFQAPASPTQSSEVQAPIVEGTRQATNRQQALPAAPTMPPYTDDTPATSGLHHAPFETEPLSQREVNPDTGVDKKMLMDAYAWWSPENQELPLSSPDAPIITETTKQTIEQPLTDMWNLNGWPQTSLPEQKTTRRSRKMNRRRVIAMLAAGGVLLGSGGAIAAWSATHHAVGPNQTGTVQLQNAQPTAVKITHQPPTNTSGNHQGTLIGSTTQAPNTAVTFTNPTDQKGSLLVHLPNGSFAAYEQACTHEGVTVNYDPKTMKFICPAHGAIFDPTHNGRVVRGPAMQPLPPVAIKIQTDGTITAA